MPPPRLPNAFAHSELPSEVHQRAGVRRAMVDRKADDEPAPGAGVLGAWLLEAQLLGLSPATRPAVSV